MRIHVGKVRIQTNGVRTGGVVGDVRGHSSKAAA
jgi:hypothetical protein